MSGYREVVELIMGLAGWDCSQTSLAIHTNEPTADDIYCTGRLGLVELKLSNLSTYKPVESQIWSRVYEVDFLSV